MFGFNVVFERRKIVILFAAEGTSIHHPAQLLMPRLIRFHGKGDTASIAGESLLTVNSSKMLPQQKNRREMHALLRLHVVKRSMVSTTGDWTKESFHAFLLGPFSPALALRQQRVLLFGQNLVDSDEMHLQMASMLEYLVAPKNGADNSVSIGQRQTLGAGKNILDFLTLIDTPRIANCDIDGRCHR